MADTRHLGGTVCARMLGAVDWGCASDGVRWEVSVDDDAAVAVVALEVFG